MSRLRALRKIPTEHRLALDRVEAIRAMLQVGSTSPATWDPILREFNDRLEPHFKVEEGALSSAFSLEIGGELRERILREHGQLRLLIHGIAQGEIQALRAYADLLEAHVLFEERELYPAITACLRR